MQAQASCTGRTMVDAADEGDWRVGRAEDKPADEERWLLVDREATRAGNRTGQPYHPWAVKHRAADAWEIKIPCPGGSVPCPDTSDDATGARRCPTIRWFLPAVLAMLAVLALLALLALLVQQWRAADETGTQGEQWQSIEWVTESGELARRVVFAACTRFQRLGDARRWGWRGFVLGGGV
jgi:hypothetical protein